MKRTIVLLAALVCALGIFIPAAYADCTPAGTLGSDNITCSGGDADGIDTLTGADTVTIINGTVSQSIWGGGPSLIVIITGGALNTIGGFDGIQMYNGGAVTFQGNMISSYNGIYVDGDGSINSTGNVTAAQAGLYVDGAGNVTSTGDISALWDILVSYGGSVISVGDLLATYYGIYGGGDGSISSTGDITVNGVNDAEAEDFGTYALYLDGDGTVTNVGNITVNYQTVGASIGSFAGFNSGAIILYGDGTVNNTGNISVQYTGPALPPPSGPIPTTAYSGGIGIGLYGSGTVNNQGNISTDLIAIFAGDPTSGSGSATTTGDVTINNTGTLTAPVGIAFFTQGNATVNNVGDINVTGLYGIPGYGYGIYGYGANSTVNNFGNINGGSAGIVIYAGLSPIIGPMPTPTVGNASITNVGDINLSSDSSSSIYSILTGGSVGLGIFGNGTIDNTGDINDASVGIVIYGDGSVTNVGNITTSSSIIPIVGPFLFDGFGIVVYGNGDITNTGDIQATGAGIALQGDGAITQLGNITVAPNVVTYEEFCAFYTLYSPSTPCDEANYLSYLALMETYGTLFSAGILGGEGAQHVDVGGSISVVSSDPDVAPIAVDLDAGNDSLNIRPYTVINGDIEMGAGDDVVQIGNRAVVNGMVYGGEDAEVVGDLLIIGGGQVCAESASDISDFTAGVAGLDPEGDTISYLGQTYTWEEFEMLGQSGFVAPCVGKIDDGRINAYDLGAPEALYCTVEQGISVWELDLEGQGTFSFAVSQAQIDTAFATAVASGVSTLIGSDSFGNELYAISDGTTITFVSPELRESGKQYLFSFDKTTCETA